jgi:gamma-glutamyl hydrolase
MSRKLILVLLIYLTQAATLGETLPPQNPVIGIFTQTYSNTSTSKSSYIAASYVKFIEMSGGQVVPIYSFAETTEVLALLKKINGVLFTGYLFYIQVETWILISQVNGPKTQMPF